MPEQQVKALVALAQKGEEDARNELVKLLTPLVMAFAVRLAPPNEREDFYQVGIIGLLKAVARFDLKFSARFTTYAVPWIQGEMKQYRRSRFSPVKISRCLWEQWLILEKHRCQLTHQLGRTPSLSELGQQAGFSPEEIALILEAGQPMVPLSEDALPLPEGLTEETELVDRICLYEGISKLAPLERALIQLRFFQERTQEETARKLMLNQRQVSRLEKRILGQLKRYLET